MTDNRAIMIKVKMTGMLVMAVLLAACSNNPLMRTATATSTDSADAIEQAMAARGRRRPA